MACSAKVILDTSSDSLVNLSLNNNYRKLSPRNSTSPIPIPSSSKAPRIVVDFETNDDDDDVFVSNQNKENLLYPSSVRLAPHSFPCRRCCSSGSSPQTHNNCRKYLFPSLSDKELCVNSPGRRDLQMRSVDSRIDAKLLGKGGFGSVILGTWRGRRVAVKVISKITQKVSTKSRCDSVANELNAQNLKHDHLVEVLSVHPDPENNSVIIMEYVGKYNLQTLMDAHSNQIDDLFIERCFIGIASALNYIHSHNVVHLDVKPSNIFVTSAGVCKLGDFGCSRRISSSLSGSYKSQIVVGTSGYQAPEILRNEMATPKADCYSLGVTMWHVITREPPFQYRHPHTVIFQVVTQNKRPDEGKDYPPNQYTSLYRSCWNPNPHERPSMNTVLRELNNISRKKIRRHSAFRL